MQSGCGERSRFGGCMIRAGNAPTASTEPHMQCLKSKSCRIAVPDPILEVGEGQGFLVDA